MFYITLNHDIKFINKKIVYNTLYDHLIGQLKNILQDVFAKHSKLLKIMISISSKPVDVHF